MENVTIIGKIKEALSKFFLLVELSRLCAYNHDLFRNSLSIMHLDQYLYNYLFLGVFLLVAILFPLLPIMLAKVVAPRKPGAIKNAPYECGVESKSESWIQFKAQYYLYALIFVIFDIETIFIYPWAVAFKKLGMFAFVEMIIFIAILMIGLAYAWKKNALEWK